MEGGEATLSLEGGQATLLGGQVTLEGGQATRAGGQAAPAASKNSDLSQQELDRLKKHIKKHKTQYSNPKVHIISRNFPTPAPRGGSRNFYAKTIKICVIQDFCSETKFLGPPQPQKKSHCFLYFLYKKRVFLMILNDPLMILNDP